MFVVKNLSKKFGSRQVLNAINFFLKEGEIIALLGPNGAGKTTLMRCLCGFYKPNGGDILLNDVNLAENRKKFLSNMAYVCESGGLYPEMTVLDYLNFMAAIKKISFDERIKKINYWTDQLELKQVLKQKCAVLSKGFSKRVAIAGALLAEPKVLILDEPTEGLDPKQKQHLRAVLKNYGKEHIILVSTHIMEEVDALADRVLMLIDGKLVCDTTPDDLKKATPYNTVESSFCAILGN